MDSPKLIVDNLAPGTSAEDVGHLFEQVGSVKEAKIITDAGRTIAYVEMTTPAETQNALRQLNGRLLKNSHIHIRFDGPQPREQQDSWNRQDRQRQGRSNDYQRFNRPQNEGFPARRSDAPGRGPRRGRRQFEETVGSQAYPAEGERRFGDRRQPRERGQRDRRGDQGFRGNERVGLGRQDAQPEPQSGYSQMMPRGRSPRRNYGRFDRRRGDRMPPQQVPAEPAQSSRQGRRYQDAPAQDAYVAEPPRFPPQGRGFFGRRDQYSRRDGQQRFRPRGRPNSFFGRRGRPQRFQGGMMPQLYQQPFGFFPPQQSQFPQNFFPTPFESFGFMQPRGNPRRNNRRRNQRNEQAPAQEELEVTQPTQTRPPRQQRTQVAKPKRERQQRRGRFFGRRRRFGRRFGNRRRNAFVPPNSQTLIHIKNVPDSLTEDEFKQMVNEQLSLPVEKKEGEEAAPAPTLPYNIVAYILPESVFDKKKNMGFGFIDALNNEEQQRILTDHPLIKLNYANCRLRAAHAGSEYNPHEEEKHQAAQARAEYEAKRQATEQKEEEGTTQPDAQAPPQETAN